MGIFDPIKPKGLMNKNEVSQMEEYEKTEKRDSRTQDEIDHSKTKSQKKKFDKKYPRDKEL